VKETELSKQEFLRHYEQYPHTQEGSKVHWIFTIKRICEDKPLWLLTKLQQTASHQYLASQFGAGSHKASGKNTCSHSHVGKLWHQGKLELLSRYYPRAEMRNKASPASSMR